jgi:hypothetical protein
MGGTACCELSSAFSSRRNECAETPLNWSIAGVEVMAKRDKRWTTTMSAFLNFKDAGTRSGNSDHAGANSVSCRKGGSPLFKISKLFRAAINAMLVTMNKPGRYSRGKGPC